MLFPWDLDIAAVLQAPNTRSKLITQQMLRATNCPVELQFYQDQAIIDSSDFTVGCVVKQKGKFDGDSLIAPVAFTYDSERNLWFGSIDFTVAAINALLNVDGDNTNDIIETDLQIAFGYSLDGGATWTPSNNIALQLYNNAFRGTEPGSAVSFAASGLVFLKDVVGYTGGGSTKLDGLPTVSLSVPRLYAFKSTTAPTGLHFYQLRAGTDAEASPGIIRPDDYDGTDNAKVFEAVL